MGLKESASKLVSTLRHYFFVGSYMIAGGGTAVIYLKNFSNPFTKLTSLSTIAFTIGSLLLIVWSEVRPNSKELASETLKTSKRFLKAGAHILLLTLVTPLIKGESNGSVGGFQFPNTLIGAGELMVVLIFATVFLLGLVNFGLGISNLLELISKVDEEKLRED